MKSPEPSPDLIRGEALQAPFGGGGGGVSEMTGAMGTKKSVLPRACPYRNRPGRTDVKIPRKARIGYSEPLLNYLIFTIRAWNGLAVSAHSNKKAELTNAEALIKPKTVL